MHQNHQDEKNVKGTGAGIRGFSLVEIMFTVAVAGILAAIALPSFNLYQRKSRQAEARTNLAMIYLQEKLFLNDWGQYSSDLVYNNVRLEGNLVYRYAIGGACGDPPGMVAAGIADDHDPARNTSAAICAEANSNCTDGPTAIATVAPTCVVDLVGQADAFVAVAEANLDGAANDVWTIDHNKTLDNVVDGTFN